MPLFNVVELREETSPAVLHSSETGCRGLDEITSRTALGADSGDQVVLSYSRGPSTLWPTV